MRTKKSILNFLTDVLPQTLIAVIGIFKIKLFLSYLGESFLGLYQLYGQIFAYLAVFELGFSTVVLYSLYKKIAIEKNDEIASLLLGAKRIFLGIGSVIMILGFIVSFFISFFIKDNIFSFSYLQLTFMLYLSSNFINYVTLSEKIMFDATQNKYITNVILQNFLLLRSIAEIILIVMGFDLIAILILSIIFSILSNGLLKIVYEKKFNYLPKKIKPDYSFIPEIKHVIVHKISGLIAFNIDVVLISKFLGLANVVVYTTYSYITSSIQNITDKITTSTLSGVGNLINTDKKESYNTFLLITQMVFFIATIICIPLFLSINSFINIWYESKINTNLIISLLFISCLFYQIIRQSVNIFISAAGLFKETKICSILETIINLSLSLILIFPFKIKGVLFATFISLIVSEFSIKPFILYKNCFDKKTFEYYKKSFKYLIILFIDFMICYPLFTLLNSDTIFKWFSNSLLIFVISLIASLTIYNASKELGFIKVIKERMFVKNEEE